MTFFFRSRSNFRAITRLETLATQVNRSGEVTGIVEVRLYLFIYLFTVFIYLFIYLFIYSLIHQLMKDCPLYRGLFSLQGGVKMNHSLS